MKVSPLANQIKGVPRRDVANNLVPVEVELALLSLVLGVEVLRLVLLVVHPDHDAEEDGYDGHAREYSVVGPGGFRDGA